MPVFANATFLKYLKFFLLCLVVGVAGCDGSDPEDDNGDGDGDGNSATVEVSGAINEQYSGTATFASAFGLSWAITIALDDDKGNVIMTVLGAANEDTYQIGEDSEEGLVSVSLTLTDLGEAAGSTSDTAVLTSGTVTITDRSDNRVEGNFSGSGQSLVNELEINVSGEFEATCFGLLCDIGG